MTDLQYTLATPTSARDVTAVMGRRTLAWVLDFVLYLTFAIALFALLAEYVDVPSGSAFLDACDRLRFQDSDAAAGCVEIGDRAYISSNSDNGWQTLAALGYFAFFVLLQGLVGGSPGKLLTGLRVVNEQGQRAGVGRSLLRTVLWIVDGAPWFAPIVGFVTGLTTTGHRRVGDMAARTYVVGRRDVGQPVTTGAQVLPPEQGAWGAPPPTWSPPTAAPPPPTAAPPSPHDPAPFTPAPFTPAPSVSASDDTSSPPPLPDSGPSTWEPPTLDDPTPTDAEMSTEPPALPEIDGSVDIATPEVAANDDWWSGPEANPAASDSEPHAAPEMPAWEDPSPSADTTADVWSPPTTAGDDIEDPPPPATAPAGPAPFTAPGADPVPAPIAEAAPSTPEPARLPPPQWDPARNTYIQWEPTLQKWLQWDEPAQHWKDIDT